MGAGALKRLLPDRPMPVRIWRGPFRGAKVVLNPRASLRKMIGLYEHELNPWIERALRRVDRVIDVGANDGYFTFGCAAALRRLGKAGEIISIECQEEQIAVLRRSIEAQGESPIAYRLIQAFAGNALGDGTVTIDSLERPGDAVRTLVKIDVEGAEIDVIAGGMTAIRPENCFLIEVHKREYLDRIQSIFAERGHTLTRIDQRPLKWLGREARDEANWWLVSDFT